jgi:hypothetical protein
MMEWWNDIRMLCARYLVASEQMERSGPVAAVVRAAGYNSEDEEEEEGSSVEEEEAEEEARGDEGGEDIYEEVGEDLHPPGYLEKHDANVYPVRCRCLFVLFIPNRCSTG